MNLASSMTCAYVPYGTISVEEPSTGHAETNGSKQSLWQGMVVKQSLWLETPCLGTSVLATQKARDISARWPVGRRKCPNREIRSARAGACALPSELCPAAGVVPPESGGLGCLASAVLLLHWLVLRICVLNKNDTDCWSKLSVVERRL